MDKTVNRKKIIICSDNQGKIEEIKNCLNYLNDIDILDSCYLPYGSCYCDSIAEIYTSEM